MSLKALISEVKDLDLVPVEVPEWGNLTVYIKELSAGELEKLYPVFSTNPHEASLRALLFALCDASGVRVFGDDDLDELRKKSRRALDRLGEVFAKVNRFTNEDREEVEKKSVANP